MSSANNTIKIILKVIQWILSVFFFITVILAIADNTVVSAAAFLLMALLLLPPLTSFNAKKFPLLSNWIVRLVLLSLLFVVAVLFLPKS